ncbi:MAG: PKD domain-containing protein [Bryobacteraceae bacterium]
MNLRRWASLIALGLLLAACLSAQGNETKATKDDWEEINFEFDSHVLSDGYPSLLRLADILKQHTDYRVKVEGHTDYVGSIDYNEKLALARANAVKSFLVKYGTGAGQLTISGQGKRVPSVPNTDREGRFINRRVVLTVTDANGRTIAAGGISDVIPSLDDRLKKLEECCSAILKRLDKLDEILAAIRDLKGENDRLKSDMAALRDQMNANKLKPEDLPKPLTAGQVAEITKKAIDDAEAQQVKSKKFSIGTINLGPTTYGNLSVSGNGRYFGTFGERHALQAQGEYMYYRGANRIEGRQEGQFDLGLVNRFGNVQAGTFASFKYVNLSQYQKGGALGQAAFTLDYIFPRGRVGGFATHGFLNNAVVNRATLGPNSWTETYLRIVNQYGGSTAFGLWKDAWLEGNLGFLQMTSRSNAPGGMVRLVQPIRPGIAFTVEAGLNETLVTSANSGRVVFGLQFGNWLSPKGYGETKGPVPVDVPRVRYEVLTRRVGNSTPVADAGPDLVTNAGSVTLDGSASYDPDGDALTFTWQQIAGPSVSLTGANTNRATFTAAEDSIYSFRLTVRDPGGLQSSAKVTVTSRRNPQVRIARFQAQPTNIKAGETTTLVWQVDNADTVDITGLGRVQANGNSVVRLDQTTNYVLTARGRDGSSATETIVITVDRPEGRILRFLATPATLNPGEVATLGWETENAETVEISGIGAVRPSGSTTVSPAQTTTYTLTARDRFGRTVSTTATVQVVQPGLPRIIRFSATPTEILPTEQASLVWQVEGSTDVSITGIGKVEPQGTSTVSPQQNTTYTITARSAAGEVSASVVVGVITPVKILDFVADPPTVVLGKPVTLKWSTTNATDVTITGVGAVQPNGSVTINPTSDVSFTLLAYGKRSQASAFVLVKVVPAPVTNRPPIADAGPDQLIYRNYTLLDGSRSFDPDSDPITYSWRLVEMQPDPKSALGPRNPEISGADTVKPVIKMPSWGTYIFELVVRDNKGASSSAFTRVTFQDP